VRAQADAVLSIMGQGAHAFDQSALAHAHLRQRYAQLAGTSLNLSGVAGTSQAKHLYEPLKCGGSAGAPEPDFQKLGSFGLVVLVWVCSPLVMLGSICQWSRSTHGVYQSVGSIYPWDLLLLFCV